MLLFSTFLIHLSNAMPIYPSKFIDNQVRIFFSTYKVSTSNILPLTEDNSEFFRMRAQILSISTLKQSQVAKRAERPTELNQIKSKAIKQKQGTSRLILHYTHEHRLEAYKRDIHQIWDDVFANTPAMEVKVIVGHRNSRNVKSELVRTRPRPSLLVDKNEKTKC